MEEADKYEVGYELMRKDMAKMCSTENLLGRDGREFLVWHHRLNHCYFKYLLRLPKRSIIPRKLSRIIKLPPLSPKRPGSSVV